jgi:hypothetical protein
MLRPWVSFIALLVAALLLWQLGQSFLAWLGGGLLVAALLAPWVRGWGQRGRKSQALKKAEKLDWSVIDNSLARERIQRDCERPETLGICTGRDCLVYDSCTFNIKKALP